MIFSCDSPPALYFMSKREMPSAFAVAAILRATVSVTRHARAVAGLGIEFRPLHRRPAAFGTDPVAHPLVVGPEFFARLLVAVGDIARRMNADRKGRLAKLLEAR